MQELATFNPTVAELNKLVESTAKIQFVDIKNKEELAFVKHNRIRLRDARTLITKQGKEFRQQALDFQRAVIAKEKELLGIIEPEEERLKAFEEEAKRLEEREKRIALLPVRREQLDAIGDGVEATDDELLSMDEITFATYRNGRVEAKQQVETLRIEEERKALEAEKQKLLHAQQVKEAEERARAEEREYAKRMEAERVERERLAKEAEERKAREEKERLEKEQVYQDFLTANGYSENTKSEFKIERIGATVTLYKKVAQLQIP